jgi:hypothetical protein
MRLHIFPRDADRAAGLLGVAPGMHRFRHVKAAKRPGQCWTILKAHSEALPLDGPAGETGRAPCGPAPRPSGPPPRSIGAGCIARPGPNPARQIGESVSRCTPSSAPSRPAAPLSSSDAQRPPHREAAPSRIVRDLPDLRGPFPCEPVRARCPTSLPTSRRVRSCSGMSRTSIAIPTRSRPSGQRAATSPTGWNARRRSFIASTRTTRVQQPLINHDFAGYNFDRLDGLPTTSTSACRPEPMPAEGGSSTRPGASATCATPTDARRPRRGNSRRHEFLPGGGRRQFPACARTRNPRSDTDAGSRHIVDFIKAHCGPIRPEPGPTFRLAGLRQGPARLRNRRRGLPSCRSAARLGLSPRHPDRRLPPPCAYGPCASRHRDGAVVFPPDFLAFCTIFRHRTRDKPPPPGCAIDAPGPGD